MILEVVYMEKGGSLFITSTGSWPQLPDEDGLGISFILLEERASRQIPLVNCSVSLWEGWSFPWYLCLLKVNIGCYPYNTFQGLAVLEIAQISRWSLENKFQPILIWIITRIRGSLILQTFLQPHLNMINMYEGHGKIMKQMCHKMELRLHTSDTIPHLNDVFQPKLLAAITFELTLIFFHIMFGYKCHSCTRQTYFCDFMYYM